jgi:hypothetical protein
LIDWVVGIPLDVNDRRLDVTRLVAERVNDDPTRHRTVRTDTVRFCGTRDLEFPRLCQGGRRIESKVGRDHATRQDPLDKTAAVQLHLPDLLAFTTSRCK